MADEHEGKRKVRTRDGKVGAVMKVLNSTHASLQITKGGLYPVYKLTDLEDLSEEDFKKEFK